MASFAENEVIHLGAGFFTDWIVGYGQKGETFRCKACSIEEALAMCRQNFPGCQINTAGPDLSLGRNVYLASSSKYQEGERATSRFSIEIDDAIQNSGQFHIDIKKQGKDDGMHLSLLVEIDKVPDTKAEAPAVHLFSNEKQFGSVYKSKDGLVIRPGEDVSVRRGDGAYVFS